MVEEITFEELNNLWGYSNGRGIRFHLNNEEIEHWKTTGHFKHLRNELINIPNIKFICTQVHNGCWYTFFTHSRKLSDRIIYLVSNLKDDKHTHIVNNKCLIRTVNSEDILGVPQRCNLF